MPYQIACHNIKQMTIDYHYSWIWLETTGFKKNHKETGLILKVEKQTDDCFEPIWQNNSASVQKCWGELNYDL